MIIKVMSCEYGCNGCASYSGQGPLERHYSERQIFEKQVILGYVDYQLHKGMGNRSIYFAGRLISVNQEQQPSGLGGYTDTKNFIMLAPDSQIREDFAGYDSGMDQRGVFAHEKRHVARPDDSEYSIRWGDQIERDLWKLEFDPCALDSIGVSYCNGNMTPLPMARRGKIQCKETGNYSVSYEMI